MQNVIYNYYDYDEEEIKQVVEDSELIQGLLDLYIKEKQKNKELEDSDLSVVYMNGFYDGEKKWKDKIKSKIEKLKILAEKSENEEELYIHKNRIWFLENMLLEDKE